MTKQECVEQGMKLFERIESSLDKLAALWGEGVNAGMLNITECHELQNQTLALKFHVLALHCRGTAIAQRNDCDVPPAGVAIPFGGPGR